MVDVGDRWMSNRLDFEVLKCLAQHPNIPAVLVLNKVFCPSSALVLIKALAYCTAFGRAKMKGYFNTYRTFFKVDLVKVKDRLLDVTAELTCGIVNGRKLRVRPVIKPPWAEKRPESDSQLLLDEDNAGAEDRTEPNTDLSKEQLKALGSQKGWPHFKDIFMLSSVDREDVETLKVHYKTLGIHVIKSL